MNYMSVFSDFVSQSIFCRALGWTVLHSIWQGVCVGLLAAVLLKKSKNLNSVARYRIALLSLFTMLDLAVATFVYYYQQPQLAATHRKIGEYVESVPTASVVENGALTQPISATKTTFLLSNFTQFVEQHLAWVVIIWAIGVLILGLRLASGLHFIHRLRTRVQPLTGTAQHWLETLDVLKNKLQIRQKIGLVESALVKSPTALGWLRPMILMPIGLLNSLSVSEVEVILAHELSHIKAKDYLVNIFQSVIEILFYYHPIVWWLSSVIRKEREHRCDDWAVFLCGNPMLYAKTLVKAQAFNTPQYSRVFGSLQTSPNGLTMGFSKEPKNILLERVKRILIPSKNQNIDDLHSDADRFIMKKLTAISLLAATTIGVLIAFSPYVAPRKQVIESPQQNPELTTAAMQTQAISTNFSAAPTSVATPQPLAMETVMAPNAANANTIFQKLERALGTKGAKEIYENLDTHNIADMTIGHENNGQSTLVNIRRTDGSSHSIRVDTVGKTGYLPQNVTLKGQPHWQSKETTWTSHTGDAATLGQLDGVQAYLKDRKILKNENVHHIKISEKGLWIDGALQADELHQACLARVDCKKCTLELNMGEE
jgi:beta-lactamase regulating signal transducer with metallopeptidase domain